MNDNKQLNVDNDEQQLLSAAKQMLNHESEHLDMATLMKLERARESAISQPASESIINNDGTLALKKYWPGSIVALSMLMVLTFFTLQRETIHSENSVGVYSDLELLSSQESLEFYENLEFYQWLEMNEEN